MGRFNTADIDNYGGQGGAGFFSLKNDKDTAQVRFLYNGIDDVEGYAVHKVDVNGKDRYVNCLRAYNEPISKCPFCEAKIKQEAKLFIPIYNVDEQKQQVWERGKKFFSKISSICARYAAKEPLCSHIFEIERNGKKGETSTTYEIYDIDKDGTTLDDLEEVADPIGTIILDKSADDMNYYLETGQFPPEDGESEMPVRRRGRADADEGEKVPFSGGTRRAPATSGRRRDTF